jgi:SynChlorMet cassette protein ScmA
VLPRQLKRENRKLIYEKPILIVLGDTLNLGTGKCNAGSYDAGNCNTQGHSAASNCNTGYSPGVLCKTGVWRT